jgi:enoyl-CoA hydratase
MGLPEVTLGLIPGYGGTQRLTGLVGKGKALEMILTADMITAADALHFGLVNHVTGPENLLPLAEEILNKILARAPLAISAAINSVNSAQTGINGFDTERKKFSDCFNTKDLKEGITAFLEKRKPDFKGL